MCVGVCVCVRARVCVCNPAGSGLELSYIYMYIYIYIYIYTHTHTDSITMVLSRRLVYGQRIKRWMECLQEMGLWCIFGSDADEAIPLPVSLTNYFPTDQQTDDPTDQPTMKNISADHWQRITIMFFSGI